MQFLIINKWWFSYLERVKETELITFIAKQRFQIKSV